MFRILFICAGNSGRSAMAAAIARENAPRSVEIICAGDKHHLINPMAGEVMREIGMSIPAKLEHTIDEVKSQPYDIVVTLCNTIREMCPVFPGAPAAIHWALEDPGKISDGSERQLEKFRLVREEIIRRIEGLFKYGFFRTIMQVKLTFGSLLDNLTNGVLAHDLDRRIFFFNQAAQKITGYEYSEVIGKDCHKVFPGRFCGGDCSFCVEKVQELPRIRYPQTFIRRDGERLDLEMSAVTINTPANEVIGALIIFRDITDLLHMRRKLQESRGYYGIVGQHILMQEIFDSIYELADISAPILIQGESGTGKELVAVALHQLSIRSEGPFVPVNCGALPEGTLESELFGHVKGAFTGAIRDKKGRFELAEGGTIFLDEIGEISPAMQVKLLRVLQDKSFTPVGGEKTIKADARVICATNRDLKLSTQQGLFREDLYYRLAVVPLNMPALRRRKSDIPLLVDHFLEKFSNDTGKTVKYVTPEAMNLIMNYSWPGNVRELSNAIQYGMIKCRGSSLNVEHLPPEITGYQETNSRLKPGRKPVLDDDQVQDALKRAGGNKARAAKLLGVSRTTLYRFLDKA